VLIFSAFTMVFSVVYGKLKDRQVSSKGSTT